MKSNTSTKKGFTLVEMLICVVIIGILTAIAIPSYFAYMESAHQKEFEANHDLIVSAVNMYVATHNGVVPDTCSSTNAGSSAIDKYLVSIDNKSSASLASYNNSPDGAVYKIESKKNSTSNSCTVTSEYKGKKLEIKIN